MAEKKDGAPAPDQPIEASGAPAPNTAEIDTAHPAVDADPRAGTSPAQNRIDFNDPTLPGRVAVERALGLATGER